MDEEAVYEEYARSSVQAITAANELFGRLKRSLSRCSAAQSQEDQMKEAMAKAKTAYRKEYERSKHLEDEWKKMKLERDGVVAELEKAKEELEKMNFEAANEARFLNDELNYQKEDLVAAKEELVAVKEELNISREREKNLRVELRSLKVEADKTLLAEQTRLRNSREFEVNAQIKAKNDLRERCQAQFDKIRSHLEKRRESENAVGLHAQAKGTREVLQYMKSEEILDVPDSLIASFVAREERYLANCNAVEQIELLPCDLVVSEGSESIPLEAEAGVVGHGTNVELIDPVVADGLRETDAPGNELADGDASQK